MNLSGKIIILSIIAVMCLGMLTASASDAQSLNFKGTVKYVALEGGFWGIVSDDGKNYQPGNLSSEFRQDGLPVEVAATVSNRPNIHMWGTTIEITSISRLDK